MANCKPAALGDLEILHFENSIIFLYWCVAKWRVFPKHVFCLVPAWALKQEIKRRYVAVHLGGIPTMSLAYGTLPSLSFIYPYSVRLR